MLTNKIMVSLLFGVIFLDLEVLLSGLLIPDDKFLLTRAFVLGKVVDFLGFLVLRHFQKQLYLNY